MQREKRSKGSNIRRILTCKRNWRPALSMKTLLSKATRDVKKDMESPAPMDRLVCGDVGFGKTEVAIRAAFKTCVDGKQAAILVPTTILAFQHFKTFSDRLKDFPVTVDYVNRFKSAKENKETYQKLHEGKVDIIVGTHGLLAN